ncbi:MAG: helix-turn-helix domain-containing protein [Rhizomicrobium sp.]
MKSSTKNAPKSVRDVAYYRQRHQNRVFTKLVAFINEEAQRDKITKKDMAERLGKDPGQLSRLLSHPSNLTLDTISDLLLALDAESEPPEIVRFRDRRASNYVHPLIARVVKSVPTPTPNKAASGSGTSNLRVIPDAPETQRGQRFTLLDRASA